MPNDEDEDQLDACCGSCGSLWHSTADHPPATAAIVGLVGVPGTQADPEEDDFPPGYDPAEADRLIGRAPNAQ